MSPIERIFELRLNISEKDIGVIDVLINNAAGIQRRHPFTVRFPEQGGDDVIAVNQTAVFSRLRPLRAPYGGASGRK